jgi:hypothetical protein
MNRFAVLALVLAVSPLGLPVAAGAVPEALRACALEKEDAARLACFDRELARATEPAPPAAPPITPEERFGRTGDIAMEDSKRAAAAQGPSIKELTATVVSLSRRSYGELVMTLDNGQVWVQQGPDARFTIGLREKVVIKAGVLNAFTAIAPNGRTTRVIRLK